MSIKRLLAVLMIVTIAILTSCNSEEKITVVTKVPTAAEIIAENRNADIFQLDGQAYIGDIDWVQEIEVTKSKKVGEITKSYDETAGFSDGMATKLGDGTVIYKTKERDDILLVESNGKLLKYLVSSEG